MKFDNKIIDAIKRELQQPLPGVEAQYRMAPSYRPRLTKEQITPLHPKQSGVMLLLYEHAGLLDMVFTQRRCYVGVHSGQMSFPGGKRDVRDKDLQETALRETKEEIGVEPEKIEVIGKLSELYIPPSNYLVYPCVGFAPKLDRFHAQEEEVEEIVEIPVQFFLDTKNINRQTEIKLGSGEIVKVPAYVFGKHIIWGATAIMISEFTYILERAMNR